MEFTLCLDYRNGWRNFDFHSRRLRIVALPLCRPRRRAAVPPDIADDFAHRSCAGLFRLLAAWGLVDNTTSVGFMYMAFNVAFVVWMLQSYFDTIPKDLEEAAWMEGAGRWLTLRKVFLPLCLPAIAVTAIFTFINAWNEFVVALTMLRSEETYTLPIQVASLVAGRYTVEWHHVMAATLVATVPVAALFIWLQRYLVRGLALGAVK